MANIDKAEWHYQGNFPADLPPENGGTHIGMFLAWVILRDLTSRALERAAGAKVQELIDRKITGRSLLFDALDEKFFDGLLNMAGKAFVRDYYETNCYISDYDMVLGTGLPSTYHVADTWENYDKIAAVLNDRFHRWQRGEKPPLPPKDPAIAAHEEAERRFLDAIFEASGFIPADPFKAIEVLERFVSTDPSETHRDAARRELDHIVQRYGKRPT